MPLCVSTNNGMKIFCFFYFLSDQTIIKTKLVTIQNVQIISSSSVENTSYLFNEH